jgi:hypothetical protein
MEWGQLAWPQTKNKVEKGDQSKAKVFGSEMSGPGEGPCRSAPFSRGEEKQC